MKNIAVLPPLHGTNLVLHKVSLLALEEFAVYQEAMARVRREELPRHQNLLEEYAKSNGYVYFYKSTPWEISTTNENGARISMPEGHYMWIDHILHQVFPIHQEKQYSTT